MKILVVFTGGTIGSTVSNGYISPDKNKAYRLIEMYRSLHKNDVEFEFAEPYTLLSENLTGDYLTALGSCLLKYITHGYDGIIVTHGTDTLQYSAAAMSYLLANAQLPVVFVSSNFVLDNPAANGLDNFAYAVQFIAHRQGKGVFVSYRNSDNIVYIHRGTRLLPHLPYSDDLFSVAGQYYGLYRENTFVANPYYRASQSNHVYTLALPTNWASGILRVFPYPGMEYPVLSTNVRAVLLDSYHSGTICSMTPNMTAFYNEINARNIPVFLTGTDSGVDYESVKIWKQLRICTLPQASPIAMYVKLWMALNSEELLKSISLEELMFTPIGEDINCCICAIH